MPLQRPHRTRSHPVAGRLCRCAWVDVAAAVMWETTEGRAQCHRAASSERPCGVRLVVAGCELLSGGRARTGSGSVCGDCGNECGYAAATSVPAGAMYRLSGDCSCADYLADALVAAFAFVTERAHTLDNPPAAARTHARRRQHDYIRTRRGAQGAQVRTDRLECSAIGRGLASREQRWLLRDLADEAGSESALESDDHLLQRLAELRARRTAGDGSTLVDAVRADRTAVRAACEKARRVSIGSDRHKELVTWWDAYIERPLGRRPRRSNVALDAVHETTMAIASHDQPAGNDDPGEELLEELFRLSRAGDVDTTDLLGRAIDSVDTCAPVAARLGSRDDHQSEALVVAVRELLTSWRGLRDDRVLT